MAGWEPASNWVSQGVSPRVSELHSDGSNDPSRQSENDCDLCGGDGWLHLRVADLGQAQRWREWLQAKIRETAAVINKIEPVLAAGKWPDTLALQRARAKMGVLVLRKAQGYEGEIASIPCVCAADRERRDLLRRIGRFNALPSEAIAHMTFASWKQNPGTDQAVALAQQFAQGKSAASILVLLGPYGTGKTHLLVALIQEMTAQLQFARYRYVPTLMQELRDTFDRKDEGPDLSWLLESYGSQGLLGLDDLGAGKQSPSPWTVEQMETIINARYENGKPLVVTTNLGVRELADRWSPRIAERLFDRRTGRAQQVVLSAPSYRTGETW